MAGVIAGAGLVATVGVGGESVHATSRIANAASVITLIQCATHWPVDRFANNVSGSMNCTCHG